MEFHCAQITRRRMERHRCTAVLFIDLAVYPVVSRFTRCLLDVIFFSFILEENWQNPDSFCFRICTDGSSRSTTIPLKPLSHHNNVVFLAAQFIVFDTDNLKMLSCSKYFQFTFVKNPELKMISFSNYKQ